MSELGCYWKVEPIKYNMTVDGVKALSRLYSIKGYIIVKLLHTTDIFGNISHCPDCAN